jgi:hypothetical protein
MDRLEHANSKAKKGSERRDNMKEGGLKRSKNPPCSFLLCKIQGLG